MERIWLDVIAKAISNAHYPNPSHYLQVVVLTDNLIRVLREAALSGELVCYNSIGKYKPGTHENLISTTKEAVNEYLKTIESPFRYEDIEPEAFNNAGIENNSHIDFLTSLVNESPKYFDSGWIAELWAAVPGELYENKPFYLIRDELKQQIEQAVIDGELEAVTEERVIGFDDGFKEITDKNRIRKIQNGRLGNNFVTFTVYRDKFKEWLIKSKQWQLTDGCLLAKWWPVPDELDTVWDALSTTLSELNQRIEASYDGVLGYPPDSITKNEKERFVSIRNKLLDGEDFTVADIHGLIDDCNANSNSFSLIPEKLKEDIRFLASLLRATKKNEQQTEAVGDVGAVDAVKKKKPKIFEQRLDALKKWLQEDLNLNLSDEIIILPKHYTLESVYTELCKKDGRLFLCIELISFDAHFWGKQKIVELTRGNKTAII
jgi:hypothetical protein